jgi:1-acyl-sn-glycerol-3-phosphate acyltransferase
VKAVDSEPSPTAKWDQQTVERVMRLIRPFLNGYHRAEVRGLESFPPGGALVVANHTGGPFTALDVLVFATWFYEKFGYDRPLYTLTHDAVFKSPLADFALRNGAIPANHENAEKALLFGAVSSKHPAPARLP